MSLLALAVMVSGIAPTHGLEHQRTVSTHDGDVELLAFRLPDGSLPIICFGNGDDEDGNTNSHHACDQCCFLAKPKPAALTGLWIENARLSLQTLRLTFETDAPAYWRSADLYLARAPPELS